MPALNKLSEATRNSLLTLPVEVNENTPFTAPRKRLAESRVAVVTSAGLHLRGEPPFVQADSSYRRIPANATPGDLVQSHASIGFDRSGFIEDINVVFPLERLREMVSEGVIGELAPTFYSFMGAQRDLTRVKAETGPAVAAELLAEHVDAVLLTPT